MSVAEVKEQITQMSALERADVARHLALLKWSEDPTTPQRLAAAHARMDAGKKINEEQLEALLRQRRASGS